MTEVEYMKNPVYSNAEGTTIDCLLKLTSFDYEIPFTASLNDVEPHGVAIYQALLAGQAGPVLAYVPPPPPPEAPPQAQLTTPVVI